ncbi:hypothetical protein Drorol1_Dr00002676, partial [Drosera rotundifolia]
EKEKKRKQKKKKNPKKVGPFWFLEKMRRVRCSRNCLRKSLKIVNLLVTVCGVGMIIYSLWLGKKWDQGVSELSISSRTSLSRPWFIMVCLGTGMVVCLSTLCGQGVANWGSKSVLSIYVISVFSLVLLQVAVIIAIFFKMDFASQLKEYIDDEHASFKSFIIFHLYMCRLISIMALVAQTKVVLLAIVLRVVGTEPVKPQGILDVPDFKHSFLISPNSPVDDDDHLRNRSLVDFVLRTRPIESYL